YLHTCTFTCASSARNAPVPIPVSFPVHDPHLALSLLVCPAWVLSHPHLITPLPSSTFRPKSYRRPSSPSCPRPCPQTCAGHGHKTLHSLLTPVPDLPTRPRLFVRSHFTTARLETLPSVRPSVRRLACGPPIQFLPRL
ncbi:hypothetical protein CCUS01_10601, partial [Colletotrichum cuscutae]